MIALELAEIEALGLGALRGEARGGVVTRVHADSRLAEPGDLFVALNSGVGFVEAAVAAGALALVPDDQHAALAALASLVRGRSTARVVAVVGSTGKTSTKDALGALCSAVTPTVVAEGSLNNEIGLPLTVLRLEPDTRVLVTEMGMRGMGQIAELCEIARPDVVVVTSIGPEHLELVGTVANVARANAEAIAALAAGGVAVVPADSPALEPHLGRDDIEVRRFDRRAVERIGPCRFSFAVGGTAIELDLPFDARHLAENVLAALVAYDALGLPLVRAQEGASAIELSRWRTETHELPGGGLLINDAYNANPTSMAAALRHLADVAAGRRTVAVLGEMAELGDHAPAYHREIAGVIRETGVDVLVTVGALAELYAEGRAAVSHLVADRDGAEHALSETLRIGDVVLVKASRASALEGIAGSAAKIASRWTPS
ncbi:MAG: UDP-N-acetylmuramoyl-tripeptide--D-alanyl-D-alanine ligase [Gaiella sp.]